MSIDNYTAVKQAKPSQRS